MPLTYSLFTLHDDGQLFAQIARTAFSYQIRTQARPRNITCSNCWLSECSARSQPDTSTEAQIYFFVELQNIHSLTKLGPEDEDDEKHKDANDGTGDDLLLVHPAPVSTLSMPEIDSLANHLLQSAGRSVDGAVSLKQVVARIL